MHAARRSSVEHECLCDNRSLQGNETHWLELYTGCPDRTSFDKLPKPELKSKKPLAC